MKSKIIFSFLFSFLTITSFAQTPSTLYKSDQWIDVKGKGGLIPAMNNPISEHAEILQTEKKFKVTLGTKTSVYLIVSSKRFSSTKMDYRVTLNGKPFLLEIGEMPDGTYVIGISKNWYVSKITDITTFD